MGRCTAAHCRRAGGRRFWEAACFGPRMKRCLGALEWPLLTASSSGSCAGSGWRFGLAYLLRLACMPRTRQRAVGELPHARTPYPYAWIRRWVVRSFAFPCVALCVDYRPAGPRCHAYVAVNVRGILACSRRGIQARRTACCAPLGFCRVTVAYHACGMPQACWVILPGCAVCNLCRMTDGVPRTQAKGVNCHELP